MGRIDEAQREPNDDGSQQSKWVLALRMVVVFMAVQWAIRYFIPAEKTVPPSFSERMVSEGSSVKSRVPEMVFPLWPASTPFQLSIYVSDSWTFINFDEKPVFREHLVVGDSKTQKHASVSVALPYMVRNNGTAFAHIYVARDGFPIDPSDKGYSSFHAFHKVHVLSKWMPQKRHAKTKRLLGAGDAKAGDLPPGSMDSLVQSHWYPNLTLNIISNQEPLKYTTLPAVVGQHLVLETSGSRDSTGKNGWYYPIIYVNEFWQLQDRFLPINATEEVAELFVQVESLKWWKFQMLATMTEGFRQQSKQLGGAAAELEEFKRVLLETNIWLLAITGIVSLLHTVLEMLAFKSDIAHWRKKKDTVGVSVRTIIGNVFMQTVIFLYLMDNNENTSWMILGGQGFSILLEAWKITRTVNVRICKVNSMISYRLAFEDKHVLSDTERKTKEYDETAFEYVYKVAVPLIAAYAVYSLLYETHKSWYSFVITTLVGSVYAYGFLMMAPSLYINYRLKSVAHMPGKAMMYKTLNTFIDDLFAFVIRMPMLHRLATLRDDVIFLM